MKNHFPKVTVIMPIRNEINFISKSLKAVLNQNYPKDKIEIIISDGMSDDGTIDFLKKIKNNNIKIIENPEQIVPTGFNRALSVSNGEIIIRIDGHCVVDKDFINNCVKILISKNCSCVGGSIENVSKGIVADSINFAQSSNFGVGGVAFRRNPNKGLYVDTLAFGAYKRSVFSEIGGYDEELKRNQDDEFNFRLNQIGEKIWLDPKIKSKYFTRSTYQKLFHQYFGYGKYKVRVIQKRGGYASYRHLVPIFFVISILISLVFYFYIKDSFLIKAIFYPYFILSFINAVYELFIDHKFSLISKNVMKIPLTFMVILSCFIIHTSYGLGFLFGLFVFASKWGEKIIKDSNFDKLNFKKAKF